MDTNEGAGGSYIRDPKTGERKLVERTTDAAGTAAVEPKAKPDPKKTAKTED